ncbi:MAG: M1 family metallopeptidase [Planctomycetes bacterium]|nr:M1 family metallopeptidase [Planctomycetota bacterium]
MSPRSRKVWRSATLLLAFGAWAGARSAAAQTSGEAPFRPEYTIEVKAFPDEQRLEGHELLSWTNQSKDDVFDLWFHLYWNGFANNRSTHLTESKGSLRGTKLSDEWGWQEITGLRIDSGDSLAKLEWMAPDDGNAQDRTVFRVKLPQPLLKGQTVSVEIDWKARIPRVRRRTGQKDDFLFMAQWFPKLGVYETGNGWNCHQFHANTEFFADFGTYDVTIDLPQRYADHIGASGVELLPEQRAGDRVRARFLAPSLTDRALAGADGRAPLVHDFAWTADPRYVKYEDTFHWADWAQRFEADVSSTGLALGRGTSELAGRDVHVTVLLHPEHADQGLRHFDAASTSLFFYGLWWGTYPYEQLTVVDPAWGGGAAGGMEYPTLFTAGSRVWTLPTQRTPESVTVHECGHQFWYGLVGNNEFEAGWMDEGFNTFGQSEAMARRYGLNPVTTNYGPKPFDAARQLQPAGGGLADWFALREGPTLAGVKWTPLRSSALLDFWRDQPLESFGRLRDDPRAENRNGYLADPDSDPIDRAGWLYVDGTSYRTNSYRRTATVLRTLLGLVGEEKFQRAMRFYSERWRYRHPYPDDFFADFQESLGIDLKWFFEDAFRSEATIDWSVDVSQRREAQDEGWFPDAQGVWKHADEPEKKTEERGWIPEVVVRRKGEFCLPLPLELTFEGGEKETLVWSREEQLRQAWWKPLAGRAPGEKKLVSAVLDPSQRYWIDLDLSNNSWHDERDRQTPLRWSERALAQAACVLHWFAGIGG